MQFKLRVALALERFRFSRKRGNAPDLCLYAIPDTKPLCTFAGIALAAAVLLPQAPALAADYDPPIYVDQAPEYQPVEVGSGWYLRGDIGYAFSHPFKKREDFNPTSNYDYKSNEFTGSIGAGYHLNDYLRAELNFGILPTNKFSDTVLMPDACRGHTNVVVGTDPIVLQPVAATQDCNVGNFGSNKAYTVMANAYVDLGTYVGLTPYIGGGLGLAYTRYAKSVGKKDCKEIPTNSSGAGGFFCDDPAGYDGQTDSQSKFNLAYSLGAGVAYQVSKNVSLDVGYEYFAIPGGKYVAYDDGQFNIRKGLDYHQVKVGFRYDLW